MPDLIECSFYLLGVRLRPCLTLHENCSPGRHESDRESLSGDELEYLKDSINRLKIAFHMMAGATKLDATQAAAGESLILECGDIWINWQQPHIRQTEYPEIDKPFREKFDKVTEIAWRRIKSLGVASKSSIRWLKLGCDICHLSCVRGKWEDDEEVKKLLKRVGFTKAQLCPKNLSRNGTGLLPYDFDRFAIWFQVEKGLRTPPFNSLQTTDDNAQPPATEAATLQSTDRERVAEIAGATAAGVSGGNQGDKTRLRLRVDFVTKIAYFDEHPYRLPNEQACCYVAALVDSRGEWRVPDQIIKSYPGFNGARTERVRKSLPQTIRDLIVTARSKGSSIPLEKIQSKK